MPPGNDNPSKSPTQSGVSRRRFLLGAGAVAATAVPLVGVACDDEPSPRTIGSERLDHLKEAPISYADNVPPPPESLNRGALGFFTEDEAQTVEALLRTFVPGSAGDPGAVEIGVLQYLDTKLSAYEGFWEPTYREPPFVEVIASSGDERQPGVFEENGRTVIRVASDELERYGFQSQLSPRELWRMGLQALDDYTRQEHGARFRDLSDSRKDEVFDRLSSDEPSQFSAFKGTSFFSFVRTNVIEGMFSDPAYGGNLGMAGWELVGYPGAQRGYTEPDMHTEESNRQPQSLAQMHMYMDGHTQHDNAIFPVTSERQPFKLDDEGNYAGRQFRTNVGATNGQ